MNGPGIRNLIAGLRSALAGEGPTTSRLHLSITTPPQPPTPAAGVGGAGGGAEGDAAAAAAAPEEQQRLQGGGGSGGSGVLSGRDFQAAPAALLDLGRSSEAGGGRGAGAGGDGSSTADEAADVASAAEHHRLTNLTSSVDLRAVALALERGLPYALLLLFLFLSSHVVGISVYAYLSFVLFRLNTLIRSQVALKQDRQARPLLAAAGVAGVQVPLVLLALRGQDLAGNLVLQGSRLPSKFWDVVFAVVVGDTLLRYLAVLAKVVVLLAVAVDSPARFRRRGHMLTVVEYCCAVYRMLPPAPLWYHFFSRAAVGGILQTGLSGAYLLVKAQHFFERAALAALAVRQVAARGCLMV